MNSLVKKTIILKLFLVLTLFFTSCGVAGGRELNTLAIVVATGIDIEEGKIVLTSEVINPASGGASRDSSAQESTIYVQGTGNTVSDAIANTTLTFDRELYFPFSHLVIFGEEFALQGIGEYADTLSRSNEQRESAFMLVAQGHKAYDVMGIGSGLAQSPARYISEIITHGIFNEETRNITINEFFKYYFRPHEEYILGVLKPVEKLEVNKSASKPTIDVLCVEGGAAFKGDKLVGYYTGKEMIGFNFITGEFRSALIEFESPEYLVDKDRIIGERGNLSTLQIFRSKTKKDIKLVNDKLHLYIDVKFRGSINEITQGLDISQPGVLEAMEKACAQKAKSYIDSALKKGMKEFKADTFGIGELVHRKYPHLWREIKNDWDEIFSNLDYTINVTARINDAGYTNTPPNIRKGK